MQIDKFGLMEPTYDHQLAALNSKAKFTLQSGAYGSGKTLTNAWILLKQALLYPGIRGLAGAETLGQLRETLQADFNQLLAPLFAANLVKYHGNDHKYTFANGSEILFMSLAGSSPQAMRERLRSLNLGFAVIEEITAIPEDTVLEVLGRLRNPVGSRQLWGSCNPDGPEHYLYDWFFRDPRDGYRAITSNTYSNPNLPADYIYTLEISLGAERAQRYLRGEWVSMQGMVYPEFDRTVHCYTESRHRPIARFGGLDFGGANPHCMLWLEEDEQGYIYVTREWYKSNVPLSEVAKAINSDPVPIIYCDHDLTDRKTLTQDFYVHGLIKAHKDVMRGISTVSQMLLQVASGLPPRLRIHSSCTNLIKELGNYRYAAGTDTRDPRNEPIKKDDHAVDALRMALFTRYGVGNGLVATWGVY